MKLSSAVEMEQGEHKCLFQRCMKTETGHLSQEARLFDAILTANGMAGIQNDKKYAPPPHSLRTESPSYNLCHLNLFVEDSLKKRVGSPEATDFFRTVVDETASLGDAFRAVSQSLFLGEEFAVEPMLFSTAPFSQDR